MNREPPGRDAKHPSVSDYLSISRQRGWSFYNGDWFDGPDNSLLVTGEMLRADGEGMQGHHYAVLGGELHAGPGFDLEFSLQPHSDAGVIFGATHPSRFHLLHFPNCGQASRAQNSWACLSKMDDSGYLRIQALELVARVPATSPDWTSASVRTKGRELRVRVGRHGAFTARADFPYLGRIGVYSFGGARLRMVRAHGQPRAAAGWPHMVVPVGSPPDMLVVPGAEISGPGHVLAFGLEEIPQPERGGDMAENTATTIRRIKEAGGIAVLAHPIRSGYTWKDLDLFCEAGLDGMEVLNCSARGSGGDAGRSDQIWHLLLRDGRSLIALGTDDAHRPHEDLASTGWGGVSHAAWTGVLAREFSVRGILEAMREGRTYASEGPEIVGIEFREDGKLVVSSSPCVACHFRSVGGRSGGSSVFPPQGEAFAERFVFDFAVAGYRLQDRLVIVLEDALGRRAWVSPIRLSLTMEEASEQDGTTHAE